MRAIGSLVFGLVVSIYASAQHFSRPNPVSLSDRCAGDGTLSPADLIVRALEANENFRQLALISNADARVSDNGTSSAALNNTYSGPTGSPRRLKIFDASE
jgi:hypothetical protein